jgi:cobalt-zinc-cadmium efflux system membrane fusion protein
MKGFKIFCSVLISLFVASCQSGSQSEENLSNEHEPDIIVLTDQQKEMAGIQTGKIKKSLVAEVIDCAGFIDVPPTNISTLHAPIDGIVQRIDAIPGLSVEKDQLLVVLADPEIAQLQEDYLFQKFESDFRETEYLRKKSLYEQEAISKKDFLEAKNEFNHAKTKLNSLEEQLKLMGISVKNIEENGISSTIVMSSPFNGYISDVFVNMGMYVDESKPLVEVINYDHVHVELMVYSNDIGKLEIGQPIRFQLAGTDKTGWARIQLIGKKVDEDSRSVIVHAHIDSYAEELTIGTSIMAEILTRADSAYALPEEAIINEGDLCFVFEEEQGKYQKIEVITGRTFNAQVEIKNYTDILEKNIVQKGAYYLAE